MRFNKGSQEGSQQIKARKNYQDSQNGQSEQNYLDDDDPINCPLMFKATLASLITIGILAFIITFAIQVQDHFELYPDDFATCQDSSNLRRISKYYAYEKMILGLSISGLVLAFGIAVYLIKNAYDFCRCFDQCYDTSDQVSQEQSESQNGVEVQEYENQLKKRMQSNLAGPKDQMTKTNILPPKKKTQKQEETKIKVRNPHIRKYLRPAKEIRQIDKDYDQNGGNSNQIDCDCECDDVASCMACCSGCLWWRTCFDAHHYRFYKTKNEQYAYWIIYLIKTLFFGTALAYVIRIHITLNEMSWCTSVNAKSYNDALYNVMIIGIITVCVDVFGYVHLLVEGSLLEVIEDTLNEPRKSQHSEDSDSDDDQSSEDNKDEQEDRGKKKKAKKYQQSQSESEDIKAKKKKKSTSKKFSEEVIQSSSSQEIPTKLNLISSVKKDKSKPKFEPQQQNPAFSKDTDSFFIKIKTLGDKFMNDINSQNDEDQTQKQKKKQKPKKIIKDSSEPQSQSQESYESSNKKPGIFVTKNFDKLPKFQTKKTVMVREQESVKQSPFWKSELKDKKEDVGMFGKQKESQRDESQFRFKRSEQSQEKPIPSGVTKFGAFNRASQSGNKFSKDFTKPKEEQKESKANQFQKLSKFSTRF